MSARRFTAESFYIPAEVAEILRCSEWWVKEQARKRRIPFTWIGGGYLFTQEQVAEILSLFEVRPIDDIDLQRSRKPSSPREAASDSMNGSVVFLRARVPRRSRNAAASSLSV